MQWLNYHHLLYFWTVARRGSVARAAEELHLAQPTVSGQIRALEETLGERLFTRSGRHLALTDVGRMVFGYADDIFSLGRELQETLRGLPAAHRGVRLQVGIAEVVPKLVAHRLLQPVLEMDPSVHIVCREDKSERLLAELALHHLDVVICDAPIGAQVRVRAFQHPLGDCAASVFGSPALRERFAEGFPRSLHGAPMLLPTENTALRHAFEQWCVEANVHPRVLAEFEDSALLKTFGADGAGLFLGPAAIEEEIASEYRVEPLGRLESVRERFYAVTVERRIKHPAVAVISDVARRQLFTR